MFAFSEKGRDPCIYLYSYPARQPLHTLHKGTQLEFADLAFDRTGGYLASLGTLPEFELFVWSVEERNREPVVVCESNTSSSHAKFVSFNPLNSFELCTSGSGHVTLWRMEKQQSKLNLVASEGKVANTNARLHSHAWSLQNEVLVGTTEGAIYRFDTLSAYGDTLPEASGTEMVSSMVITKHHLIVASEDGVLKFYNHTSRTTEKRIQLSTSFITSLRFTVDWGTMVVGCADGVLFAIHMPGYNRATLTAEEFQTMMPRISVIADFHGGAVTSCSHLAADRCLATVGADCTLRVWDYHNNVLKSKTHIGDGPTCMACGVTRSRSTLAVGHTTGTVRLVSMEDVQRPKIVFRTMLDQSEVLSVKYDSEGTVLAIALASNKLFFMDAVGEYDIYGYVHVAEEGNIKDFCWIDDMPQVMVTMDTGDVWCYHTPTEISQDPEFEFKREALLDNVWKLDFAAVCICYGKTLLDSHHVFTIAEDKGLKLHILTRDRQVDLKEEMVPLSKAHCVYPDFSKMGSSLTLGTGGNWLLATGRDGKAVIRDIKQLFVEEPPRNPNLASRSIQRHSPLGRGINKGCFSSDGKYLFTVGADGFILCCNLKGPRKEVNAFHADAQDMEDEREEEDNFVVKRRKEAERFDFLTNESYREQVKGQVRELATRLKELKEANAAADPMEKLDGEEFVVESERQAMQAEGDKMVEDVKEDIRWKNIARDYLAEKIKKECYDVMDERICVLRGLVADTEVANYNIKQKSKGDVKLLKKLKFLRRVEIHEARRREIPDPLEEVFEPLERLESEPDSPTMDEPASPVPEPSSPLGKKGDDAKKAEDAKKVDELEEERSKPPEPTDEELADQTCEELLYSPYLEYTRQRAVLQMHLLNGQVNFTKVQFNKEHTALLSRKKGEIARIAERNQRIFQIISELESAEEVFEPALTLGERPEMILEVKDEEITVEKWLSPEERKRQQEQREEAERRRREQEDDAIERGLKMMMDGKLERDDLVVVKIHRPEFADTKPQEDWSDEELKLFKDYENKVRKKQEEDEKKRKQLEAELKNIRKDNMEIAHLFDAALLDLLKQKLDTDQTVFEFELRTIKLAQSVLQREDMEVKEAKLTAVLEDIKLKASRATQHVLDFKRDMDLKAEKYEEDLREEKNADKRFRQQYAEAEEHIEVLLRLLKKKANRKTKKALESDKAEKDESPASMDPFAFVDQQTKDRQHDPADIKLDKPDGLPETIWTQFLQYRLSRIEMEKDMKETATELGDMQKYYQKIKTDYEDLHTKMELNLRKLTEFHDQMVRDSYNLDILHRFKQGQIEVEQAAVVTDYADAILIHKSKIQDLNGDIRGSGAEKVKILREIKDFKKGIRAVEWENEMLDYTTGTLEIEYRHLHTLRVTKAMQEFIKGGGEGHNESERAKLLKKIQHVRKTYEGKVEEKKKQINRIKRVVGDKQGENDVLDQQTSDATSLVQEREEIVGLQSTGLDYVRAQKMMKDLRVTRKLEDVAKAQQDELRELKAHIDKLRERTFPSFAVVSKRVVGNPDQRPPE